MKLPPKDYADQLLRKVNGMSDDELRNLAAESARHFEQSKAAKDRIGQHRARMPEEVGSLLASILAWSRGDRSYGFDGLPEVLHKPLESLCAQNQTQMVPFAMIAERYFFRDGPGCKTPTEILQELAEIFASASNVLLTRGPQGLTPDAAAIFKALGMTVLALQCTSNLFGWNIDDLRLMARKLADEADKGRKL